MEKLYLVRRSLETYIGPMTLSELKRSYRRMEFGLQDEVAGNRGEWIALDDLKRLKSVNPEISKLVSDDLLGGWGISEHSQKKIIRGKKTSKKVGSTQGFRAFFIVFFIMGLISALHFSNRLKVSALFNLSQRSDPESIAQLVEADDMKSFDQRMDKILPKLIPKVRNSRNLYNQWIPYLRLLAFHRDGEIPGFNAKLLRGMGRFSAPNDCSHESWQRRWNSSFNDWALFEGKENPRVESDWARILVWDSSWMHRRRGAPGWKKISHYYEACLIMANKALRSQINQGIVPAGRRGLALGLVERISYQLARIHGDQVNVISQAMPSALKALSCIENAEDAAGITECRKSTAISNKKWSQYLQLSENRHKIFLFLRNKVALNDDQLTELRKLHRQLKIIDPLTEFSYQAESQYLVAIMLNNGSLMEARKQVGYEFPEVSFAH